MPADSAPGLRAALVGVLLAVALLCGSARAQSTPTASAVAADSDAARISDLVKANHILANEHVLDGLAQVLGERTVVLMRGHGMAVVAPSVRMVVMRAIYTQLNAQIESQALQLGAPTFLNAGEASRTDPPDRPWEIWSAAADRATRALSR